MFLILSTNIANAITIVVPNVDTNVDTGGANAFLFGDSVSRVYTNAQLNDVNNPTAFGSDTVGLVTQFTTVPVTQPVPEPSTVVLLCLGIAAFAIAQWLRKRKSQPLEGAIG